MKLTPSTHFVSDNNYIYVLIYKICTNHEEHAKKEKKYPSKEKSALERCSQLRASFLNTNQSKLSLAK
jgi:hypothetical protein